MHDVFGNSVALVDFRSPGANLRIASTLKIERYGIEGPDVPDRAGGRILSVHLFEQRPRRSRPPARAALSRSRRRAGALGRQLRHVAADAHARSADQHERGAGSRTSSTPSGTSRARRRPARRCKRRPAPAATSPWCSSRRRVISASARVSCPAISTIPRSTKARRRRRPPPPMPGRKSICPAPAGSNTTRPTC